MNTEEIFNGDQTVPAVEMQHTRDFMLVNALMNPEELASQCREVSTEDPTR